MKNDDFIECCQLLTKLAILKGAKKEEQEIALMAKFLLSEISLIDIKTACSFIVRREKFFPDVSVFFNLVVPMQTIDEIVELSVAGIIDSVKSGVYNRESFNDNQKAVLEVWSWSSLKELNAKDLNQARISISFFLRNKLSNDGKTKLYLNKSSIDSYKSNLNHLEQGEQNAKALE